MSWIDHLNGDSVSWLLEPSCPEVRYVALRDLVDPPRRVDELAAARRTAHASGNIPQVLNAMQPEGYWERPGAGYNPKYRSTVWALILLAQLGADLKEDTRIEKACIYLLDNALASGGQFSTNGAPSGTIDCLQGNLCWALTTLGCNDQRLAKAYEWMARSVTGEGVAPNTSRGASIRYYAYKTGPCFQCSANGKMPCAWGAVKVMLAFGTLPVEKRTPLIESAIQTGVAYLFSVDPANASYAYAMGSAPSRNWWKFGFPVFYITDLLQIVEALTSLGYGRDPRLEHSFAFLLDRQNKDGRWSLDYDYTGKTWGEYGQKKAPNKWVTLRVLRVLKAALG